jgi:hypothetical protein
MFSAYYDPSRFRYIHEELHKSGLVRRHHKRMRIRKTACFYGEKINFYIDTSDGRNEDLQRPEYTSRIRYIVKDSRDKPFIVFKSAHSPVWSQPIMAIAEQHGGRVVPFHKWSFNDDFYKYLWPNRHDLRRQSRSTVKEFDIGFAAKLTPYWQPDGDIDPKWLGGWRSRFFGPRLVADMPRLSIETRRNLHDRFKQSRFRFWYQASLPYEDFIAASMTWIAALNPPGFGEYTSRMFDHACLGQCVILRKTSYDFGNSWKQYLPEVDFTAPDWEQQVQKILDEAPAWREKSLYYFENKWSPPALVQYLQRTIEAAL